MHSLDLLVELIFVSALFLKLLLVGFLELSDSSIVLYVLSFLLAFKRTILLFEKFQSSTELCIGESGLLHFRLQGLLFNSKALLRFEDRHAVAILEFAHNFCLALVVIFHIGVDEVYEIIQKRRFGVQKDQILFREVVYVAVVQVLDLIKGVVERLDVLREALR
jgi:hypothetical protein